jgi:hypothetical protein
VTNARAFYTTRAAAGATGTRLSLRPLISRRRKMHNSAASRREIAVLCLAVIPGCAKRRPQVRNCASGNLEIPGSMLRIAPE